MTKTWQKLTPEEATKVYCVPAEIANDPDNHFWGFTYIYPQELFEGDWPLVALIQNSRHPSTMTLQIRTLPMELIHVSDFDDEPQNYNSLDGSSAGGYLHVPLVQAEQLCNILRAQKSLSVNDESVAVKQPTFRALHDDEIQLYRLHPEWLPGVQKSYYIQVLQPEVNDIRTISLVSVYASTTLNMEIMTFEESELLNESFTPLSHARPQLHLNWSGILELVDILSQAVKEEVEVWEEHTKEC